MKQFILISLLLTTVATPIVAQDRQDWNQTHDQRGDHRGDQRGGEQRGGDQRGGDHRDNGYRGAAVGDHRDGGYRGDWRNDNRYRWEDYRRDNRQVFSLGRFYAPRGWSYRRFSIGVAIPSILFGQRYWIRDPYAFRLPPAPYGAHWVRYYGDALLIQNRNGRVLDVVYGIFN
jgi:Ni/Co efflux regulator RcnB